MTETKTTYYYNEYELETQKLNQLSDSRFQVILKFKGNDKRNVLFVKALFNNLGNQVFDIEVKTSIYSNLNSSENGVFNFKLPILEEDKAKPFLLMAKVFNSVQTTNLSTTLAIYSKLQSNTFSMKLFGINKASVTTSKIFKLIGIETIGSTNDGINYTLKEATTIKSDESLTIPSGKFMNFNKEFTNYGEVIIGNGGRKSAKDTTCANVISSDLVNNGNYTINDCLVIYEYSEQITTERVIWTNYKTINNKGELYIYGKLLNYYKFENNGNVEIYESGIIDDNYGPDCGDECMDYGYIESKIGSGINGVGTLKSCNNIKDTGGTINEDGSLKFEDCYCSDCPDCWSCTNIN